MVRTNFALIVLPIRRVKIGDIVDGNGTIDNPYRLEGDNDANLSGTLLNTRYSGEYVRFGNDENNLYRIVSHENGTGTKITSAEPLKNSGTFIGIAFGDTETFSSTNTIGTFLNGEYLTSYVDSDYSSMIEDITTWYLGTVRGSASYKLAKYTDTDMSGYAINTESKVGLLRYGELMAGQFERSMVKGDYLPTYLVEKFHLLTPTENSDAAYSIDEDGKTTNSVVSNKEGVKPALNLKSNVIITGGLGTKEQPFTLALQ